MGVREIVIDVERLDAHEPEPPPAVKLFCRMGFTEITLTSEETHWEEKGKISF